MAKDGPALNWVKMGREGGWRGVSEETHIQSRMRGERKRGPWPRYQGQQK